ncbi:MAG TPA: hypothetical protein VGH51_10000 [Candidatus Angelobacter sp.]|jgi:hypothetical protein
MKITVLAVLLAVMQTSPPIPRQTANDAASRSGNINGQTKAENNSTTQSTSPANQNQSDAPKRYSQKVSAKDESNSVRVRELPPVSVTKDWADWGVWMFSALLTVVGFLQVGLLYYTLKAIRRQADWMKRQTTILVEYNKATREAADAAKKNAIFAQRSLKAMIGKERARIRVKPDDLDLGTAGDLDRVIFNVICFGVTPAFITESSATVKLTDSVDPPAPDFQIWSLPTVLEPTTADGRQQTAYLYDSRQNDATRKAIREGKLFIHFYGYVEYKDVFDRQRKTRFRYLWRSTDLKNLDGTQFGRFEKHGQDEDNSET